MYSVCPGFKEDLGHLGKHEGHVQLLRLYTALTLGGPIHNDHHVKGTS